MKNTKKYHEKNENSNKMKKKSFQTKIKTQNTNKLTQQPTHFVGNVRSQKFEFKTERSAQETKPTKSQICPNTFTNKTNQNDVKCESKTHCCMVSIFKNKLEITWKKSKIHTNTENLKSLSTYS